MVNRSSYISSTYSVKRDYLPIVVFVQYWIHQKFVIPALVDAKRNFTELSEKLEFLDNIHSHIKKWSVNAWNSHIS